MSAIYARDTGDAEDRAYEEERQREVDGEPRHKRHAFGMSPEELSLQDARIEGQRAGANGVAAGLNPWQSGSPEYEAWERGRSAAEADRLHRRVA